MIAGEAGIGISGIIKSHQTASLMERVNPDIRDGWIPHPPGIEGRIVGALLSGGRG